MTRKKTLPSTPKPPRLAGIRGHHHGTRLGVLPWSKKKTSRAGTSHHSLPSWRLEYHLPMSRKKNLWCSKRAPCENVAALLVGKMLEIDIYLLACRLILVPKEIWFLTCGVCSWITRGFLQPATLISAMLPWMKKIVFPRVQLAAFHLISVLSTHLRQWSKRN